MRNNHYKFVFRAQALPSHIYESDRLSSVHDSTWIVLRFRFFIFPSVLFLGAKWMGCFKILTFNHSNVQLCILTPKSCSVSNRKWSRGFRSHRPGSQNTRNAAPKSTTFLRKSLSPSSSWRRPHSTPFLAGKCSGFATTFEWEKQLFKINQYFLTEPHIHICIKRNVDMQICIIFHSYNYERFLKFLFSFSSQLSCWKVNENSSLT